MREHDKLTQAGANLRPDQVKKDNQVQSALHDGSDVVLLSCYNQAPVGGMSMCASATTAFDVVKAERPEYAQALTTDYTFSRNGEQAEGEDGLDFDEGRELELKGMAGTHTVHRAEWEAQAGAAA